MVVVRLRHALAVQELKLVIVVLFDLALDQQLGVVERAFVKTDSVLFLLVDGVCEGGESCSDECVGDLCSKLCDIDCCGPVQA